MGKRFAFDNVQLFLDEIFAFTKKSSLVVADNYFHK